MSATREKRKRQRCRVFELKITGAKMSRSQHEHLRRLFLEAKWFYNHVLSQDDVFNTDTTVKSAPVKCGDRFEERELRSLSSQMKQSLAERVQTSIKGLSTKKKHGAKVGKLKFKRSVSAVLLKQHGNTYSFTNSGNRLKLQRLKGTVRIRGFDQLPAGADLANAVLLKKASGYYLKVTVYTDKEECRQVDKPPMGIDIGIKHQFAFSNGVIVDYRVPMSQCEKLRSLYRELSRRKQNSANWYKTLHRIRLEFEYLANCKHDIIKKLCGFLAREHGIICFQKESLSAWQRLYGRKLLDTSLGSFLSAVKERAALPAEIDRWFPSTQLCSNLDCNHRAKKALSDRVHHCPVCGLLLDRDINAAINIEQEGIDQLIREGKITGTERCLRGGYPATLAQRMVDYYNTIPRVSARLSVEARSPLRSS